MLNQNIAFAARPTDQDIDAGQGRHTASREWLALMPLRTIDNKKSFRVISDHKTQGLVDIQPLKDLVPAGNVEVKAGIPQA